MSQRPKGICADCQQERELRYGGGVRCTSCYRRSNSKLYNKHLEKNKQRATTLKARFSRGKSSARQRKLEWKLSFNEYRTIIEHKNCFYCSGPIATTGVGLDRINHKIGYLIANVVACCGNCNFLRGNRLTVAETMEAVKSIKEERNERIKRVHENNIDIDNRQLYISGDITDELFIEFKKNLNFFEAMNPIQDVTIIIVSGGGDLSAGLALYDCINNSSLNTIGIGLGQVCSAATLAFVACKNRITYPHTTFLIHSASVELEFKSSQAHNELQQVIHEHDVMCQIYSKHTSKPLQYWIDKLKGEYYFAAQEAIDIGVAHEIKLRK